MARRDRREVTDRMAVLLAQILKCRYQPGRRTRSWLGTILIQRQELDGMLDSALLRLHAADVLAKAYARGVQRAALETGLPQSTFPAECPYSLDEVLEGRLDADSP